MTAPKDVAMPSVALLEDDVLLRERVLTPGLAGFGFAVTGMDSAAALHVHLAGNRYDIAVLDVGLPDADGFAVARELRDAFPHIGIVMLTGRGETLDRVRGLSLGADAYLSKPVEVELLAATLHSVLRRLRGVTHAPPVLPAARGSWQLDPGGWCLLSPAGSTVALTRTERRVVERLTAASGQLVTRDQLVAALTDNVYDFDPHRLDSLIYRLRRKVANICGEPLPLNAVHGEGYVLATH